MPTRWTRQDRQMLGLLGRVVEADSEIAEGVRNRVRPAVTSLARRFERNFAKANEVGQSEAPEQAYEQMVRLMGALPEELQLIRDAFNRELRGARRALWVDAREAAASAG